MSTSTVTPTATPPVGEGVWAELVGQERAVETLRRAVAGERARAREDRLGGAGSRPGGEHGQHGEHRHDIGGDEDRSGARDQIARLS